MRARVSSLLHQIKPLAKDGSLGHEARMSLRTDIERMEKALADEHWPPGAGRHGASPQQIVLAWLLARSPQMLPIPALDPRSTSRRTSPSQASR